MELSEQVLITLKAFGIELPKDGDAEKEQESGAPAQEEESQTNSVKMVRLCAGRNKQNGIK